MSVSDPKKYWKNISKRKDWIEFILPKISNSEFEIEGYIEAERLSYFFDNNDVVLDYGCGIERVAKFVSNMAKSLIGPDINPDFISRAKRIIKQKKNAHVYLSDEYSKKNVADLVYSLMALQHNAANNRTKIIKHIYKFFKKGGTAIIQFPKKSSKYYQESDLVHKFERVGVEGYGKIFDSFRIIEGNLPNYAFKIDMNFNHEYFLIAGKD